MGAPVSTTLAALLELKDPQASRRSICLSRLRDQISTRKEFCNVKHLLSSVHFSEETILVGKLLFQLEGIRKSDSHVRDILTTGHLGKYLCRRELLESPSTLNLMGLPNTILDLVSLKERDEYFNSGKTLHVTNSLAEARLAEIILQKEQSNDG